MCFIVLLKIKVIMFYIVEKKDQLIHLPKLEDCFVIFIPYNDNFHPYLQKEKISLVYVRDIDDHKGYILCLNHNESFSLDKQDVEEWLLNHTDNIFVLNKKEALYYFPHPEKLFDINFIEKPDLNSILGTNCHTYYYNKYFNLPNINCIIPISKHYEQSENIFNIIQPIIKKYDGNDMYKFNNEKLTYVFHHIEENGIKLDKDHFFNYYSESLKHPEFNIHKSKIYSQYNLYTTTGRPSNAYNNINFAALNKTNGERMCYRPDNDVLLEMDFNGYHPRLIGELVGYPLQADNIYDDLDIEKTVMFENLYGGIRREHTNHPYFKHIQMFIDDMWDTYQYGKSYNTSLRKFNFGEVNNQTKMFNYIIQGLETYTNVNILSDIIEYLQDKKTKIILYVYDSILLDYALSDGEQVILDIKNMMHYPVNIKTGKNYHDLKKI
jgi:hypothetical protein